MKRVLFIGLTLALQAVAEDLTTITGKQLLGVSIERVEPDGLVVMTDSGIEKVPFSELPEDVQKKYGFDPQKAAQFSAAESARQARLAAQGAQWSMAEHARRQQLEQERAKSTDRASTKLSTASTPRTNNLTMPQVQTMSLYGRVLQSFSEGILVECEKRPGVSGYKAVEGLVLVRGVVAQEDSYIKIPVIADGHFDYSTLLGAQKRVPAFVRKP
jgi:hypothetical protein